MSTLQIGNGGHQRGGHHGPNQTWAIIIIIILLLATRQEEKGHWQGHDATTKSGPAIQSGNIASSVCAIAG
eukprot:10493152-Karenia_brevis.AAC.1